VKSFAIEIMKRSQVRQLKNNRYNTYYRYDDEYDEYVRERETWFIPNGAPHAPNKNEGKVIRRIMSQTGLSEDQVWKCKTYRIQIAQASNPRNGTDRSALMAKRRLRRAAAQLALPVWHPEVIAFNR
jgi:hypothetical protein